MSRRPSYAAIVHRESFKHETLKLSENSIRLFQVQSGTKNDPLSLRITQYAIHKRPAYKAISYTWGSVENSQPILVNGRSFSIHPNLCNLLFYLRERKESSFLWADRLCIDQQNLVERNFHVQLMGAIYDQAISVIVWLGLPAPDRTEIRAIDFIKEIAAFRKNNTDAMFVKVFFAPELRHRWETLLRMCNHHYWGRTWIVQEFIRASEVELVCGNASMNWKDFEGLLHLIDKLDLGRETVISQLLKTRPVRLTLRRQSKDASTLHELLVEYHDSKCSVRSDKVYGIIGLASDCGEDDQGAARGVQPDYKKHVVQVYVDAISCVQASISGENLLPAAANLVRRALWLRDQDFTEFIRTEPLAISQLACINIVPDYVGIVQHVISSWHDGSDLRHKLTSLEWGNYVGYEMKSSRPGIGRRSSSRAVHATLPDDILQNTINAAELEPELANLHNYPQVEGLKISSEHMTLGSGTKRYYDNENLRRPAVILEQPVRQDMTRLGFACTNTRVGDLLLQFKGLDVAIIMRRLGSDIILIGKAVAIKHSALGQCELDSVCDISPWYSPCPSMTDCELISCQSDALSLAELLTRT